MVLNVIRPNIDPKKNDIGSTINKITHYKRIEYYYMK